MKNSMVQRDNFLQLHTTAMGLKSIKKSYFLILISMMVVMFEVQALNKTTSKRTMPESGYGYSKVISHEGIKTLSQQMDASQRKSTVLKKSALNDLKEDKESKSTHKSVQQEKVRKNLQTLLKTRKKESAGLKNINTDIYIASVDVELQDDLDNDGYYSRLTLSFDVDTLNVQDNVYAELYLRSADGPWVLFHTTRTFRITEQSLDDTYEVSSNFLQETLTDDYDVLIDVYRQGENTIIATLSSEDDTTLAQLPLESREFDTPANNPFYFYEVVSDLQYDEDEDGYFSEFALEFDVDTDYAEAEVYTEIWSRKLGGQWFLEYTSDDFILSYDSEEDRFGLDFIWETGYSTDLYDFLIVIRDSFDDRVLVEAGSELSALNSLPLESYEFDEVLVVAGSFEYLILILLLLAGIGRIKHSLLMNRIS